MPSIASTGPLSVLPRSSRRRRMAGLALLACLGSPVFGDTGPAPLHDTATEHAGPSMGTSPLVEKVRAATRRYLDINVALGEGWVQATPCVSSPTAGAMGIHFLKPERLRDGELKADEPEMLIYEPLPEGKFRLVGVEYVVIAADWCGKHASVVAPSVDGHLANFVGDPNRYALPAFYEMHVWAWQDNAAGSFADFNPRVSCAPQATPA